MKFRMSDNISYFSLVSHLTMGLFISVAAPQAAQSQPTVTNASAEIAGARASYVRARIVLVNPSIAFAARLVESSLKENGCNYYVSSKKQLSELVEIISRGQIAGIGAPDKRFVFDARIGVFLFAANDAETKLVLEGRYWDDTTVYGFYNDTIPVQAGDPYLSRNLRKWASALPPNPSPECDFITKSQTSPILRR